MKLLQLLVTSLIIVISLGQQIRQRSIAFAPFRLECPKLHGVMRMTIEMTNSAGGNRRDLIFTDICHHMDSFFPIPPQFLQLEKEECEWSDPLDNFSHSKIKGKCPENEYFAGLSRIAPKTVAFLCCKLRTRKYGDCAQLDFPTVTPTNPTVDFYDGRGVLVSIEPTPNGGQLRAKFCTLVAKEQDTIIRAAELDLKESESTTTGIATQETPEPIKVVPTRTTVFLPPRQVTGAELIQENITTRNTGSGVSPLVSESIDNLPIHKVNQQPWRPIIISDEEHRGQLGSGLPPPPPPIRPSKPSRRQGLRRKGLRRPRLNQQRHLQPNNPRDQHEPLEVASALRSRIQPNKDIPIDSRGLLFTPIFHLPTPIVTLSPEISPITQTQIIHSESPAQKTTVVFKSTPLTDSPSTVTSKAFSNSTSASTSSSSAAASTAAVSSSSSSSSSSLSVTSTTSITELEPMSTVHLPKETAELVAGNGIFQFILGKRTKSDKKKSRSELRYLNTPPATSAPTTTTTSKKIAPTASFDFDVDFDVIPPKSESDRSQALIIFEHSLKDKSVFGKPMKLRRFPLRYLKEETTSAPATTEQMNTVLPSDSTLLPEQNEDQHTVMSEVTNKEIVVSNTTPVALETTTRVSTTAKPRTSRRRNHWRSQRRRGPTGKVLRFCSKDIAVLDGSDMIIACGLGGDVWDPPHCPHDGTCMEAHDASFMICCPVYHG